VIHVAAALRLTDLLAGGPVDDPRSLVLVEPEGIEPSTCAQVGRPEAKERVYPRDI